MLSPSESLTLTINETTTGHILIYDLVESESGMGLTSELFSLRTPRINIDVPHILQSFPPGAGQGEVYDNSPSALMTSTNIPELRFRAGGIMRFRNEITGQVHLCGHATTSSKGLLVALRDVGISTTESISSGGFLRIPQKIPANVIWKGSQTHSAPDDWAWVDDDGEEQVDIDKWSWEDVGIRLADDESTYGLCSVANLTSCQSCGAVPGHQDAVGSLFDHVSRQCLLAISFD